MGSQFVGVTLDWSLSFPLCGRKFNFNEVEMPWSENVATRQAKRCLRCDYGKRGMVTTIDNINATHK